MGLIAVRIAEDFPWQTPADSWPGKVAAGQPQVKFRTLCEGSANLPDLRLVQYEPGHFEAAHSHDVTEVLYILQGELDFGGETVRAGSAIVIEKNTTYGPLKAGAEGTEFLRIAGFSG